MKGDRVVFRGPLENMAEAQASRVRIGLPDLYVAAISWWSAAITPAVSTRS